MKQVFVWGVKSMKSTFLSATVQKFIPWMNFLRDQKTRPTLALPSPQQFPQFYSSLLPLQQGESFTLAHLQSLQMDWELQV